MRRTLAGLVTGLLALTLTGLVEVGGSVPAVAAPDYPTVESVTFQPSRTVFDSANETLTAVVELDAPGDWPFVSAHLKLTNAGGGLLPEWLKLVSQERIGQVHTLTFRGQVPDGNRYVVLAYPDVFYRDTTGTLREVVSSTYSAAQYLYGDTRISIDGPARITPGESLRLTGRVTCYRNGEYPSAYEPAHGGPYVYLEYRDPDTGAWVHADGSGSGLVNTDGTWAIRILSVGASLDWRAVTGGTRICEGETSRVLHVAAGTGEPPAPPALPGAPGLTVGRVTRTTVALDWSPASGRGITGYRFGWESEGGRPQPSWSQTYTLAQAADNDPFVMTNLAPGTTYTMWVEAVTADGSGDRATVSVTTAAAAVPPPPGVVRKPSVVRSVSAAARNRAALVHWRAPTRGPVDRYQVHRAGRTYGVADARRRSLLVRGLVNGRLYRFTVRAHNPAGWGPWSAVARVRPHR